jgi:hypothetical protein
MRGAFLLVGVLSGLAMANAAMAGKNDAEWNPPARFDHDYSGELYVRRLPQPRVWEACRVLFSIYGLKSTAYPEQRGCSIITSTNSCLVVTIDREFKKATPEAVLRHEIGHCNGWPADHPD